MSRQVEELLSNLSIEQKIGQLLILGWQGESHEDNITVSKHARVLVEDFQVGGIILLGRNVGTPAETTRTMNRLQEMSKVPLFIIADQEGGMVCRFKDPYVVFPSNMALGATRNPQYAYMAAYATARQLRAVGVNFDFAPCVDVNNNPLNPIIGTRSYADNPEMVAEFAQSAIRGFHDGGVATSAKHFPGHGDTSVDSHLALPIIDFPRQRIESTELPPFKAAIQAGVATIMTTHIMFPQLDPELPATISPTIIGGLLRQDIGYQGVIVTDCLEMEGVNEKWGTPNAAVMAFKAGVDCLLICHTLERQIKARELLLDAVRKGDITLDRLDTSVRRILELKERFGVLGGVAPADPEKAFEEVASQDKKDLSLEIARKAVTIAKNQGGILPLKLAGGGRLLLVSMHPALPRLQEAFQALYPNVSATAPIDGTDEVNIPHDTEAIIVATCPSEPWTEGMDVARQARMVNRLIQGNIPVVALALRDPYDIRDYPEAPAYVCTYGYRNELLQAAAEAILGKTEATGQLPVSGVNLTSPTG